MTTDPPEPKPRRKWHFYKWLVLLTIATFAYPAWNAFAFRSALKQAEALGWEVEYIDPFIAIPKNWKLAFKKEIWVVGVKDLFIPTDEHFEQHSRIILRLNPRWLQMENSPRLHDLSAFHGLTRLESLRIGNGTNLTNLDALKNLTTLKHLVLRDCPALPHLDALKNLAALETLNLSGCTALTNVDPLINLTSLQVVNLSDCTGIIQVDALKQLPALQTIYLRGCAKITNVDALKNLKTLEDLGLDGCTGLTKETIKALKAAMPKTYIFTE